MTLIQVSWSGVVAWLHWIILHFHQSWSKLNTCQIICEWVNLIINLMEDIVLPIIGKLYYNVNKIQKDHILALNYKWPKYVYIMCNRWQNPSGCFGPFQLNWPVSFPWSWTPKKSEYSHSSVIWTLIISNWLFKWVGIAFIVYKVKMANLTGLGRRCQI